MYLILSTYVIVFDEKCFLPKNFFWGSVRLIPVGDMSNSTRWAGAAVDDVIFGMASCCTASFTISSPSGLETGW